jgi:hypothetical protein
VYSFVEQSHDSSTTKQIGCVYNYSPKKRLEGVIRIRILHDKQRTKIGYLSVFSYIA